MHHLDFDPRPERGFELDALEIDRVGRDEEREEGDEAAREGFDARDDVA